jgi:type VI secretion system secreted protein VgrG
MLGDLSITSAATVDRLRPAKVTLTDHDFKHPAVDLTATSQATTALGREHYDHPGRYVEPGEGQRRADALRDAFAASASFCLAKGVACALAPGQTFALTGTPDEGLREEHVVRGARATFRRREGALEVESELHLLPKGAPYRPLHRAPRPRVPGPEPAIVTGPPGEEIHTDEHGRVKVYFPWDRRSTKDDKSSAWIRVGQMHTSGSVAIPRVGWEVLVAFEDGDPDRPIVLGRLYNGIHTPPYDLPGKATTTALKSMSTPGGAGQNEIRMDDSGGGEHIHVHAQKDLNLSVANNKTEKITTNADLGVGSNHAMTVGANETLDVGADHQVTVGGSQTYSVGGSRTKSVGAEEKITITGARALTIGGSHTITTARAVSESTSGTFSETVGGSCIEAAALGVGMAVAGAASVSVGGAKIEACVTGKSDCTLGAQATTIGGAYIAASGKDAGISVGGARATTVGGAWAASAGGDLNLSAGGTLSINVGGLVAFNAGTVVFKVGGSNVTISGGGVTLKAASIKLTATGPQPELAPMVEDK